MLDEFSIMLYTDVPIYVTLVLHERFEMKSSFNQDIPLHICSPYRMRRLYQFPVEVRCKVIYCLFKGSSYIK